MTGCPTHGQLLGGYVLGALEPAEADALRAHLTTCPGCAREYAELAVLPGLLDRIEPDDVPPPVPSPALEEAVLDRVARERGARAARAPGRRGVWRGRRRLIGAGVGAALAAAVAILVVSLSGGDGGYDAPYPATELRGSGGARARAELARVPAGTRVRLDARGLPRTPGAVYELWCIRDDGQWVSGGTFLAPDGTAEARLTAAVHVGDYHRIVVVRRGERAPRDSPRVLAGELPRY